MSGVRSTYLAIYIYFYYLYPQYGSYTCRSEGELGLRGYFQLDLCRWQTCVTSKTLIEYTALALPVLSACTIATDFTNPLTSLGI